MTLPELAKLALDPDNRYTGWIASIPEKHLNNLVSKMENSEYWAFLSNMDSKVDCLYILLVNEAIKSGDL